MNQITRKLVLSIIAVVLTVFALGSTTFAWFTLTNTASVQTFSADIIADSGIEIALQSHDSVTTAPDEANWKTTITTADVEAYLIATYGDGSTYGALFNHVTTENGVDFKTLGASSLPGVTSGYVELPFSFRSNTANQINWTAVSLTSPDYSWTVDVNFTDATNTARTAGDTITVNAANGMRIAITAETGYGTQVVGYEKPTTATNVVMGGNGTPTADSGLVLSDGVGVDLGDAGAMNYYYAKNNSLPFSASSVTLLGTITDLGAEGQPVASLASVEASTFGAIYFGQVTVRVWLEGWDANTYNSILSQAVSASFQFTGVTI